MKLTPFRELKALCAINFLVLFCIAPNASAEKAVSVKAKPDSPSASKKVSAAAPTQVARGKKLFERLTCVGCHPNGENSLHPYRPLKGPGFRARYKEDGQIEKLIRSGVAKAGMPAFNKTQVNDRDMKDLIAFIRSMTPNTTQNAKK